MPIGDFQLYLNNTYQNVFTRKELVNCLKSSISSYTKLVDYRIEPYSEESIGSLSSQLKLILIIKTPESDKLSELSLFLKTIPYNIPSQVAYIEEKGAFRKEVAFLQFLLPIMTKDFKGETWSPQCHLVKKNAIVFEDMKCKGFSNRYKLFDEKATIAAVACLARFHASSFMAEQRLNGKPLNELFPDIVIESEYNKTDRNYAWYTTAVNLIISVAKDLGLNEQAIRRVSDRVFDIAQPSKNKRNVVVHGDLWSNNFLFDDKDHCKLVDFQLIRYAPPGQDLMQLLYLTTTRAFREKHEQRILEHYYVKLNECLLINDYTGDVPNLEEVIQGVKEQRFPALIAAAINLPTMLMVGNTWKKIMIGPEVHENYFFRDRRPFYDKAVLHDIEYEKRFKEVVYELAEMSLKVKDIPRPT